MRNETAAMPITLRQPFSLITRALVYIMFLIILALIMVAASPYSYKPYVGGQIVRERGTWLMVAASWGSLAQVENVHKGSQVVAVNGMPVDEVAAGETFIPSRKVHALTVKEPGGGERTLSDAVGPVPWQTKLAGTMQGLLAFLFWLAALIAWIRKPRLYSARLFMLFSLCSAVVIAAIMGAQYDFKGMVVLRTVGYIVWPALFVHFAVTFPQTLLSSRSRFIIYLPALMLIVVYAAWGREASNFDTWFKQATFAYLVIGFVVGITAYVYTYLRNTYERYRLQIRLVSTATLLGMLPFLVLSLLPQVIRQSPSVPPNLTFLATGLIPMAFAFVMVRERLPAFAGDTGRVDGSTQAKSMLSFATLTGDLETLSAYITENVSITLQVADVCLLAASEQGFRIVATTGHWANDLATQTQLLMWASRVTEDHVFPNLAPSGSGCQLFVPLESQGDVVGMLCLGDKKSGTGFQKWDIDLLSEFRKGAVAPLHNAVLLERISQTKESLKKSLEETYQHAMELEKAKASLERAYLDVGRTVVLMLESRDPYTRGHSERVARLCRSIALKLNLSAEEMETVELAAKLHDIGKVATPDRILQKPGPLEPQERAEMELHPARSLEVLRFLSFMEKALPVIEGHHEAWDGSGYPRGLRGEGIPLGARIIAVADAFDAMTSPRSYRPAVNTAEAVRRLNAGAGVRWDPRVVQAFLETMPEG